MKPAIILSAHTMALGVVRALGAMGAPTVVVHYDERDTAHRSRYATHTVPAPHPEHNEKEFVSVLLELADQFSGGVLFPVSDETLVAVSKNREILSRRFAVACPEWPVVQRYVDKQYTYAAAEKAGVPAPRTLVPNSVEAAEEYAQTAEYPCLVKPCQSHLFYAHFKRKMFPVESPSELLAAYQASAEAGLEVMLQEIVPGGDRDVVNYNAYISKGEPLLEFTAEHIRNAPPKWGSPRVARSCAIPEVIEPGRKILRAIGFEGYACVELKRDIRSGIYKLIEVNGRHNLSTLLAVKCGANFPWLHYCHLAAEPLPSFNDVKTGVYWIDILRDLGYGARYWREERYSPGPYFRPYFSSNVFALADRTDPKPFLRRCAYLGGQALRAGWSSLKGIGVGSQVKDGEKNGEDDAGYAGSRF